MSRARLLFIGFLDGGGGGGGGGAGAVDEGRYTVLTWVIPALKPGVTMTSLQMRMIFFASVALALILA